MEDITLGQIAVAIGCIMTIIGGVEFLAYRERRYIEKIVKEKTAPIESELKVNTLNTLKCTMCIESLPLSERIQAGKEYVERGGNGGGKIYYHRLEEEYERKLQREERL